MFYDKTAYVVKSKNESDITELPYNTLLDHLRNELYMSWTVQLDAHDTKYMVKCPLISVSSFGTSPNLPYTKEYLRRNCLINENGMYYYDLNDICTIVDTWKRPYTISVVDRTHIIINYVMTPIVSKHSYENEDKEDKKEYKKEDKEE